MNDFVDVENVRTEGKYIVIFEKSSGKTPEYGSLSQLKIGDIVCIHNSEGHQSLKVGKITGSKWTKKIRSVSTNYQGFVLTPSQIIDTRTIRRILRLKLGEKPTLTLEERDDKEE